jgi:hypothetical protein
MNTRIRSNFVHALFATAAIASLGAQAADSGYFEEQRAISDGYFPQYNAAPRHAKPESALTAAQNEWLIRERIADSNGSKPQQFVPPAATLASSEKPHSLGAWIGRAEQR